LKFGVMVESIRTTSKPARFNGVATARMPRGAVASELANDGKKKTIFLDERNGYSPRLKSLGYLYARFPFVAQLSPSCNSLPQIVIADDSRNHYDTSKLPVGGCCI
jgi:hypothetical protein